MRSLQDLVTKDDFVESENLTTLLVVVSKYSVKEFLASYESLAKFVVPRSAKSACDSFSSQPRQLSEDNEYALYRVVVFKRTADEFKSQAREKRYVFERSF